MTSVQTGSSAAAERAHVGGHYALFKVIQGKWFWYQSKAYMRLSDCD